MRIRRNKINRKEKDRVMSAAFDALEAAGKPPHEMTLGDLKALETMEADPKIKECFRVIVEKCQREMGPIGN